MENLKSHRQYLTIVFDITKWSDTQTQQMLYREDARILSWDNVIEQRDAYITKNKQLEEEIKRLQWILKEQD